MKDSRRGWVWALALLTAFAVAACGGGKPTGSEGGADSGADSGTDDYCGGSMTATFDLGAFNPQTNADGFNLDGANTPDPTPDAAGCYQADTGTPPSIDSRFQVANEALAASGLDLGAALGRAFANGSVKLRIAFTFWNGTLTNDCFHLRLEADAGSGFVTAGETNVSMTNGLVNVVLPDPWALTVPVTRAGCVAGTYGAGGVDPAPACASASFTCTSSLTVRFVGVHLRLHIVQDASSPNGFRVVTTTTSRVETNPSMFGAHVVFWDSSAGRPDCSTTPLTGDTLEAGLQKTACDLGLGASATSLCEAFASELDLHDANGALTACAAGASAATSNANAISFDAYVGE